MERKNVQMYDLEQVANTSSLLFTDNGLYDSVNDFYVLTSLPLEFISTF